MKRLILTFVLISTLAVSLSACGSMRAAENQSYGYGAAATEAPAAMPAQDMVEGLVPMEAEKSAEMPAVDNGSGIAVPPQQQDRLVIQNADMAIVVTDPQIKMEQMAAMAERMGGFVVSSNIYQTYAPNGATVNEGSIVIRVPAEKLNQALDEIKSDVVDVQTENRSGQDVTQEYVDLKSRLKNLEAAEAQLEVIMDEAKTTEEVMNVFNQLVYYREQIELVKGQMQYYEQSAAYSAISARLIPEETIQPIEIGGWQPAGVARDAIQSLITFLQGFGSFLINLFLFILPVLIILGLFVFIPIWLVYLVIRAIVRRSKKNNTPPPAAPAS